MRIYTALLKPDAEPVLVREGFSFGALLFGSLWLAWHRAWIPAAIVLAIDVVTAIFAPPATAFILFAAIAVILGLTGHDLRRWSLENRGYLLSHVVAASSIDQAFIRLLANRPDLATSYRVRLS